MENIVVIMNKGQVYEGKYFHSIPEARNYIKWRHPKKKWKEPRENELVCSYTGMKMNVIELMPCKQEADMESQKFYTPCTCKLQLNRCTLYCEQKLDYYEGRVRL